MKDEDRRLQRELTQLQESTHADIERIRKEASESYDRWVTNDTCEVPTVHVFLSCS